MLRVWNCLQTQHDWRLVLLAAGVCLLTSLAAVNMFQRARVVSGKIRLLWLGVAGLVTGCGVWATHFIGMLAYNPGFTLSYNHNLTALSLLVATVMTTAGFVVAVFGRGRAGAALGGAWIGIGIAGMHYIGIASIELAAEIIWMPDLVATSIALGMIFGAASLMVAQRADTPLTLFGSAGLLTLAITSHHFVAMGAIGLIPQSWQSDGNMQSPMALSLAVASVTAAMVVACLIGALSDRKTRRRINERNIQLDAALNNMGQGLCMFDADSRLQIWNERYLEMYNIPPEKVFAGCSVDDLFAARTESGAIFKHIDVHSAELNEAIKNRKMMVRVAEIVDGRTICLTTRPMAHGGWIATHEDITERKKSEARIAHLALHDPLTDLPNRTALNEHLARTFYDATEGQTGFAVMCIDLDHFKQVNDVHGHSTGDAFLCEVARRLMSICRTAFVARVGGDEFIIVSSVGTQPAAAEDIWTRLSQAFDIDVGIGALALRASITGGVSIYPQDGLDAETLLANADAALYHAKTEERGSIRFFGSAMDRQIREKRVLQRDLVAALANNEFELYFQPQATATAEIVAFEVLVRWRHPSRGLVSPGVFIPLAEETGLITAIDAWILRQACIEAASWPNPLPIAVNLSPIDFRRSDVPTMIHTILLETGLAPKRLEIEITEGVLIDNFSRATSILRRIKSLGVSVAMDDFGTGYSSLSYLQSFPFDKIKIDQAFIAELGKNVQSAAIVRAILGLGRGLNLPVVAEGVETQEQFAFLAAEGCSRIQGYLIGRPQPISQYRHIVAGTPDDLPVLKKLAG